MIKKLRKNIILVNMLLMGTVIIAIFTVICVNTYVTSVDNLEHALNLVIERNEDDNTQHPFQIGGKEKREVPVQISSYVVVAVDNNGEILSSFESNATIDDDDLKQAVKIVLENTNNSGQLGDYSLMYVEKYTMDRHKIAFADTTSIYETVWNTTAVCAGLCIGSLIIVFLISLALSGLAVKPVKKAWTQQKQFVADASHELKTPLTVILANNNILMSHEKAKIEDEKQWLESTDEEAKHMKKLIDQMLYLAKSDAGQNNIAIENIDISDIVEGTILNFEPVAYEKGVSITSEIQKQISLLSNSVLMTQLSHILIDNAVKYSFDNSEVIVKLAKANDICELIVNNKGNSISEEDIKHIFDRFYRADKARTEGGYGLGLSIAQNITNELGGKITVESNNIDGTTFKVLLYDKKKH